MNKLSGLDSLTDEAFEQMTEQQQMIVEAFFSSVFVKVNDKVDKESKKLTVSLDSTTQKVYKKTGITRDLANLIIEQLDNIISFYAQGVTQAENLLLKEKYLEAKREIGILIEYRKILLLQRSVKEDAKVGLGYTIKLFLKFSFVYPFKMFFFAKDFYTGIKSEVIDGREDCGASLALGRMFEAKLLLKTTLLLIGVVGLILFLFKAQAFAFASAQVAAVTAAVATAAGAASTGALAVVGLIGGYVITLIPSLLSYVLRPLNIFSYFIITRCEDTGPDSIRKQEISLKAMKKSLAVLDKGAMNIKSIRKNVSNFFILAGEAKAEVEVEQLQAEANKMKEMGVAIKKRDELSLKQAKQIGYKPPKRLLY